MRGTKTTPKTWPTTTLGETPKNKREIVINVVEKEGGIVVVI